MSTIRKALTAAGVGLVGALGTALADGDLTGAETLIAVSVGLTAGAAVYGVRNTPAPAPPPF